MIRSRTLAAGALLALPVAAGYAAGPDAIGAEAYERLSSDFAANTIVVRWGGEGTPAMREAALAAVDGAVVATDEDGAQIVSVGVGLSRARIMLEQFPSSIIAGVESTDAFVGNQFGVDSQMLETLTVPAGGEPMLIPVVLDGGVYTLELAPRSVRSADFRLLVEQADGTLAPVEAPPVNTYRGRVVEMPGSDVAASLSGGGLTAMIVLADDVDAGWFIQPLSDVVDGAPADVHVVYDGSATLETDAICGGGLIDQNTVIGIDELGLGSPRGLITAEIAFDADFQFYQQNGSNSNNVNNDINNILNGMNTIYERDCGVTFVISEIVVRTTSAGNPYTSNSPDILLTQFRNYWLGNHAGIHRDLAHLMTGRNMDGSTIGIAWLSAVCTNNGFGVSQSRFTTNFNSRVALTAHEVGHNFSAQHCSGGSCHIMCAGLGGCGGIGLPNFGTASASAISNYAGGRPCLDNGPPPNEPPTVQITTPVDNTTTDEGNDLFFSVLASDPEQGDLGASVVWLSSRDGVFGLGNGFLFDGLSAGDHTITASVADTEGLTDEDSVVVHITGGAGAPPDQPARPTTRDLGDAQAQINWVDLPNETEWDVQRQHKVDGVWGETTTVATGLPADTTQYVDAADYGVWRYRIRARNSAGNSPWSAWRNRKLLDLSPPAEPTNFDATNLGGGQAHMTWTDNSTNEAKFQIQRQRMVGGSWSNEGIVGQPPADTEAFTDAPGADRVRYRIRARNRGAVSGWTSWSVVDVTN
jgi:hypothetical protein